MENFFLQEQMYLLHRSDYLKKLDVAVSLTDDLQLGQCDHQHISIVTYSCALTVLLILNAECVL